MTVKWFYSFACRHRKHRDLFFSQCYLQGTLAVKKDLAIFSNEAGPHAPLIQVEVHSADYPGLQAQMTEFLTKVNMPVDRAYFDVAGPVIDGQVKTANSPSSMSPRHPKSRS